MGYALAKKIMQDLQDLNLTQDKDTIQAPARIAS